jgi:sulfate/thiosulfate transport system permease protein
MSALAVSAAALSAESRAVKRPSRRVLAGFNLTLGYTLPYLSLIVLIPIPALLLKTFTLSWEQFWMVVTSPRVLAS